MLKLPEVLRDQICGYLKNVIVPASVGADLTQISSALGNLEKIPDAPVKAEEVQNG